MGTRVPVSPALQVPTWIRPLCSARFVVGCWDAWHIVQALWPRGVRLCLRLDFQVRWALSTIISHAKYENKLTTTKYCNIVFFGYLYNVKDQVIDKSMDVVVMIVIVVIEIVMVIHRDVGVDGHVRTSHVMTDTA